MPRRSCRCLLRNSIGTVAGTNVRPLIRPNMETSMPDEQTPTPHLEKLFREVAEDEFWAIRGKTINGYADLEQSLCQLFCIFG
jgi:hypothetical protein